ncbi:hypothetical protein [Streptomyces sp. MST-110588]|uniref:hypothetical protein n=1 Tax=Streptomyces sp. MST-110588 TaxID=2833628 RepID=UPI001F5DFAED|nr:hypothetical protein [Streptomyces sp. MST-110588]
MDERTDTGTKEKGAGEKGEKGGKRIDLSLAQVAGSSLAAAMAAFLAGRLGVYGTIVGAGLVSVVATTGGPVFQHFFRRTGEQLKEVTVSTRTGPRRSRTGQVPPSRRPPTPPWCCPRTTGRARRTGRPPSPPPGARGSSPRPRTGRGCVAGNDRSSPRWRSSSWRWAS